MLRLTAQAADHLARVRAEKGFDSSAVPRFIRRAGKPVLTFARGPEAGDRVVDSGRLSTLVAASAVDLLDDVTIDVRTTDGRSMLVVRRGKVERRSPAKRAAAVGAASS